MNAPKTLSEPIRLMSFNVRNMRSNDGPNGWDFRKDLLINVVRRFNPDVLGTQEAYAPQVEALAEALPNYLAVGVGRDDGDREGEYCAVFVRTDRFRTLNAGTFWFSETPDVAGSRQWTPRHPRICTWAYLSDAAGRILRIANVHLDHEVQPARENSAHLLIERILHPSGTDPVVIMGDFNVEVGNPTIRILLTTGVREMYDSYRVVNPEDAASGTFHGFQGNHKGERIDYILTSSNLEILDASIVHDSEGDRLPSDHFPVTAVVRLTG
jgi:endonuclease/exonuclease/phosphatase family metal-dependent hydrolase